MECWKTPDLAQMVPLAAAAAIVYAFTSVAALRSFAELEAQTFAVQHAAPIAGAVVSDRARNVRPSAGP